jgi:serine/threonine protein kinase
MQTAPDVISSLRLENLDTLPVLARYELRREVGRGGMSVVYEAYDRHTEQTVALKVLNAPTGISPDQAELILSQFLCEARAVAGLSHPNVIAIYDTGEENGRHFLVMEFLEGETLRERLVRGPMTLDQAEPVLRQVAAALDAVHTRGILHGDIKPSNVLLSIDGTAKLLDFGIALHIDDCAQVIAGPLMGSPAYLSPEQIRGNRGSAASDIWALGTLLYEMLAGRPAFTGKSVSDVLHRAYSRLIASDTAGAASRFGQKSSSSLSRRPRSCRCFSPGSARPRGRALSPAENEKLGVFSDSDRFGAGARVIISVSSPRSFSRSGSERAFYSSSACYSTTPTHISFPS